MAERRASSGRARKLAGERRRSDPYMWSHAEHSGLTDGRVLPSTREVALPSHAMLPREDWPSQSLDADEDPGALGRPFERRRRRSDDPITALHYQLSSVRAEAQLAALVLIDEGGCLIAGAGAWPLCEELAAYAPLLARPSE